MTGGLGLTRALSLCGRQVSGSLFRLRVDLGSEGRDLSLLPQHPPDTPAARHVRERRPESPAREKVQVQVSAAGAVAALGEESPRS